MAGCPAPAAAPRRPFHLSVTIDAELLRLEPGLAAAIQQRLEGSITPPTSVSVSGGDTAGFTVEASSDEDVEELGPRGGHQVAAGIQWVEDQATEILDRIMFPATEVSAPVRAGMATVLALAGRAVRSLLLVLAVAGVARADDAAPTTFRSMLYGAPGAVPEIQVPASGAPDITVRLELRCRMSLLEHAAAMYLPGGLSDGMTTEWFLAQGGREMNPLLRNRWVRVPVKVLAEPLAAAALERWVERHWGRTEALLFRAAMWGTRLYASISNIRYGNRLRSGR
jgi:hypothetical protein